MTLKYRHRETKEELQCATPSPDSKHIHITHADGSESKMTPAEFAQTHELVRPEPQPEAKPDADLHAKLDKILSHLEPKQAEIDASPEQDEPAS